jgi:hypothetical protein
MSFSQGSQSNKETVESIGSSMQLTKRLEQEFGRTRDDTLEALVGLNEHIT